MRNPTTETKARAITERYLGSAEELAMSYLEAIELLKEPCTCIDGGTFLDAMGAWICEPCNRKAVFLNRVIR